MNNDIKDEELQRLASQHRLQDESGFVLQDKNGMSTPTVEEINKQIDKKLEFFLSQINNEESDDKKKGRIR